MVETAIERIEALNRHVVQILLDRVARGRIAVGAGEVETVVIEEREHLHVLEATAENCSRLRRV